jgi:thioredoxin 1
MSKIINATANEFENEVINSETAVLVDFWAPWCGPCVMMGPVLEQIAEEMSGKLKVVKVDVENQLNMPLAQKYQIMSIPNMKLFKNGKVVKELIGMRPKEAVISEIENEL